jgi:hypothetical protein
MPSLEIKRYNLEKKRWTKRGEVKFDVPQTIINLKPDGKKEIILLECTSDGSESIIQRMELGDKSFVEPGKMFMGHPEEDPVQIARLKSGDSLVTTIQDLYRDNQPTRYRFSHK